MEINYQETSKDLLVRIDIHEKYGACDIDEWNMEVLQPKPDFKILDVGCGAGKQCFLFSDNTERKAEITGGDFSEELLEKARAKLAERGDKNVKFQFLDFDKKFDFVDDTFDLLSSAFAIYYASDLKFTFAEAHRVIKPGGRLFVTDPLPENKQMFYDIIKEAYQAGVSFKACNTSLKMAGEDMIEEVEEKVGAAYVVSESMDDNTVTFTY